MCYAYVRPRLDKMEQGADPKISLSSGVPWVNTGLPFPVHWQTQCLLQSWLRRSPATRGAENNPLVTTPLGATTFLSAELSLEAEGLTVSWEARPLCRRCLLPSRCAPALPAETADDTESWPRRWSETALRWTDRGFLTPISSSLSYPFTLLFFPELLWTEQLATALCRSFPVPRLYWLWLTPHSRRQRRWAGGCCEDWREGEVGLRYQRLQRNIQQDSENTEKGNSLDCDSYSIRLATAFREFQWDHFFCERKCGILLQHVSYRCRRTSSTLRYIVLRWTDLTSDMVGNREKQYENHWHKGDIVK